MGKMETARDKFHNLPTVLDSVTAIRLCRFFGYTLWLPLHEPRRNDWALQIKGTHEPVTLKMDDADREIADFVAMYCISEVIRSVGNKRFDTAFDGPDEGGMGEYKHNVIHLTAHTFLDRVGDETDDETDPSWTQIGKNRRRLFSIWMRQCRKYEKTR